MKVHFKVKSHPVYPLRGTIVVKDWRNFEATSIGELGVLPPGFEIQDVTQTLGSVTIFDTNNDITHQYADVMQVGSYWYLMDADDFENLEKSVATT